MHHNPFQSNPIKPIPIKTNFLLTVSNLESITIAISTDIHIHIGIQIDIIRIIRLGFSTSMKNGLIGNVLQLGMCGSRSSFLCKFLWSWSWSWNFSSGSGSCITTATGDNVWISMIISISTFIPTGGSRGVGVVYLRLARLSLLLLLLLLG